MSEYISNINMADLRLLRLATGYSRKTLNSSHTICQLSKQMCTDKSIANMKSQWNIYTQIVSSFKHTCNFTKEKPFLCNTVCSVINSKPTYVYCLILFGNFTFLHRLIHKRISPPPHFYLKAALTSEMLTVLYKIFVFIYLFFGSVLFLGIRRILFRNVNILCKSTWNTANLRPC